jgi:hypothetical protein
MMHHGWLSLDVSDFKPVVPWCFYHVVASYGPADLWLWWRCSTHRVAVNKIFFSSIGRQQLATVAGGDVSLGIKDHSRFV